MNLCRLFRETAEGLLFRNLSEMRKGKRMRWNKNIISGWKGLRTGLFAVCLSAAMCAAAGCGSEDKLLAELRQESAVGEESAAGTEDVAADEETAVSDAGQPAGKQESSGTGQPVSVPGESGEEESDGGSAGMRTEPGEIYVHVCGAVKNPGVYALTAGSRFYEAVEAAGGFAEDACEDYLNMAAILADGSRLEIPTAAQIAGREQAEKETAQGAMEAKSLEHAYYTLEQDADSGDDADVGIVGSESGGLVNINTADVDGLCKLPGIGEGRAKAIIEYREKQGGFRKKEDIMQVSGIGEKMYARMEAYLTVE